MWYYYSKMDLWCYIHHFILVFWIDCHGMSFSLWCSGLIQLKSLKFQQNSGKLPVMLLFLLYSRSWQEVEESRRCAQRLVSKINPWILWMPRTSYHCIVVTNFALQIQMMQQSCAGEWPLSDPGGAESLSRTNQWVLPKNRTKQKPPSSNRMKSIHWSGRKYNFLTDI